jgi:hypothetical protein
MNAQQPLAIQDLPIEILDYIFGYLSSPNRKNDKPGKVHLYPSAQTCRLFAEKVHLYRAAQTCRLFAALAIPKLWYDLEFYMDDRQPIHSYQRSFLQTLTPASSRHFRHTRRLTLGLYTLDNVVKLDAIHHRLIELLSIYQFASPWLKHLELGVGPFI